MNIVVFTNNTILVSTAQLVIIAFIMYFLSLYVVLYGFRLWTGTGMKVCLNYQDIQLRNHFESSSLLQTEKDL